MISFVSFSVVITGQFSVEFYCDFVVLVLFFSPCAPVMWLKINAYWPVLTDSLRRKRGSCRSCSGRWSIYSVGWLKTAISGSSKCRSYSDVSRTVRETGCSRRSPLVSWSQRYRPDDRDDNTPPLAIDCNIGVRNISVQVGPPSWIF